jgi:hypothetical protein
MPSLGFDIAVIPYTNLEFALILRNLWKSNELWDFRLRKEEYCVIKNR